MVDWKKVPTIAEWDAVRAQSRLRLAVLNDQIARLQAAGACCYVQQDVVDLISVRDWLVEQFDL